MALPADERDASGLLKRVPWEVANELELARGELYERAEHTQEFYDFLKRESLDRASIEAHAGVLVFSTAPVFRRAEVFARGILLLHRSNYSTRPVCFTQKRADLEPMSTLQNGA